MNKLDLYTNRDLKNNVHCKKQVKSVRATKHTVRTPKKEKNCIALDACSKSSEIETTIIKIHSSGFEQEGKREGTDREDTGDHNFMFLF